MKILHITHTDITIDSRILKELESISRNFSSSKVVGIGIYTDDNKMNNLENVAIESIKLKTKKWIYIPRLLRYVLTFIELFTKLFLVGMKHKPNIIHCHDVLVLPVGSLIKIFNGSKLVYDAHELESKRANLTKLFSKIIYVTEKIFWGAIDSLIVVSPSIQNWYEKFFSKKATEIVLNSPVIQKTESINEFDKNYLHEKYSIPLDKKIFIYIGILREGRGIEMILDTFKSDDIKSHVVFLGYGEMKNELIEISKKYSNIHVHDAVPHNLVVPVAKTADVGFCFIQNVSLSDYYCLPNKLFEYCFAEIPVLASNFPDITKVVEKYGLGKCCSLELSNIYESIKEFENMQSLPKIDALKLYDLSWEAQEKNLIRLYKKLINEVIQEKK